MNSLLGNIEFVFNCSKRGRVPELYLYYRLRMYGTGRGGYLDGFDFTHHEKYTLLPRLVKFGWVRKFSAGKRSAYKLSSHRKVACAGQNTQLNVRYSEKELSSLQMFKAWLVSLAEEYSATNNYRKQQGKSKRYSHRDKEWVREQVKGSVRNKHKITKFTKNHQQFLSARVSNSFVGGLLGVSERTVSSWRSAPFSWKSRKGDTGWYRVLDGFNVYFLRDTVSCVYDDGVFFRGNTPTTKDLKIQIPRRIFTHKYTKGYYGGYGG